MLLKQCSILGFYHSFFLKKITINTHENPTCIFSPIKETLNRKSIIILSHLIDNYPGKRRKVNFV